MRRKKVTVQQIRSSIDVQLKLESRSIPKLQSHAIGPIGGVLVPWSCVKLTRLANGVS